jgi:hypothetical protein
MMHPTGSHSPGVYWRRRIVLLSAVAAMVALTVWVLRPGADKGSAAPASSHSPAAASRAGSTAAGSGPASNTRSTAPSTAASRSRPTTPACTSAALKVAAVVGQPSYRVGEQPTVLLQVTNVGHAPCVQNLADSQVELRVYNGESRVWGSHDCTVQPGVADRTLAVGQPVRVSVVWSGLSSQPKCAGTRQRVGAGTYTLYALLSGHAGAAAQFSIK